MNLEFHMQTMCRAWQINQSHFIQYIWNIQRNCLRSVMYLTDSYGGLKIMRIFHLQGFSKMQFYCIHTRNMDMTGKLLKISSRYTQLECGLSWPFSTYDFYKTYFLITPTWTTNIWQYIMECHATLRQYDAWLYQPPRQHDLFFMDILLRSNLPQSHLEIFNTVWLNFKTLDNFRRRNMWFWIQNTSQSLTRSQLQT